MQLNSLGHRSDLLFHSGKIFYRGGVIAVHTPDNPGYYWGNYLIFPDKPTAGDAERWTEYFDREFQHDSNIAHRSLTWDVADTSTPIAPEVIEAFEKRGYRYATTLFLRTENITTPRYPNPDLEIRPLQSDADWTAMLELQVECHGGDYDEKSFREFKVRHIRQWKKLIEQGDGAWFGAFRNDELIADGGIFWSERFARYQSIETRPSYRRQGICGTLVHHLGEFARKQGNVETLVIATVDNPDATRVYQSLSFRPFELAGRFCMYEE